MKTKTRFWAPFRKLLRVPPQRIHVPVPTGLIHAVGVDIDQCLTTTGEPQTRIRQQALAMAKLQEYNEKCRQDPGLPKMFLVSGRDVRYGHAAAFLLGVHDWCIAEYGGIFYHPITGEIVENKAIDPKVYLAFQDEVRKIAERIPDEVPALRLYRGKSVMVTLERIKAVPMNTLVGIVASMLRDYDQIIDILASQIAVDIVMKGVNKGTGIYALHESGMTLVHPSRTLYIDDSMGGAAAAKVVGFAGCPSNATPEYKDIVRARDGHVSKLPLREGVVEIMRHYKIKI